MARMVQSSITADLHCPGRENAPLPKHLPSGDAESCVLRSGSRQAVRRTQRFILDRLAHCETARETKTSQALLIIVQDTLSAHRTLQLALGSRQRKRRRHVACGVHCIGNPDRCTQHMPPRMHGESVNAAQLAGWSSNGVLLDEDLQDLDNWIFLAEHGEGRGQQCSRMHYHCPVLRAVEGGDQGFEESTSFTVIFELFYTEFEHFNANGLQRPAVPVNPVTMARTGRSSQGRPKSHEHDGDNKTQSETATSGRSQLRAGPFANIRVRSGPHVRVISQKSDFNTNRECAVRPSSPRGERQRPRWSGSSQAEPHRSPLSIWKRPLLPARSADDRPLVLTFETLPGWSECLLPASRRRATCRLARRLTCGDSWQAPSPSALTLLPFLQEALTGRSRRADRNQPADVRSPANSDQVGPLPPSDPLDELQCRSGRKTDPDYRWHAGSRRPQP